MSKEQNKTLFYTQGEEEVLKNLDTSVDGLSTAQAKERLDAYGYNELDEGEKRMEKRRVVAEMAAQGYHVDTETGEITRIENKPGWSLLMSIWRGLLMLVFSG